MEAPTGSSEAVNSAIRSPEVEAGKWVSRVRKHERTHGDIVDRKDDVSLRQGDGWIDCYRAP